MTEPTGVSAILAQELDRLGAELVHVGLFDFANMFRERRLRRQELLATADTAVFANVLPKWDSAESILAPGPYGSERIAYDPASIRPLPVRAKRRGPGCGLHRPAGRDHAAPHPGATGRARK